MKVKNHGKVRTKDDMPTIEPIYVHEHKLRALSKRHGFAFIVATKICIAPEHEGIENKSMLFLLRRAY